MSSGNISTTAPAIENITSLQDQTKGPEPSSELSALDKVLLISDERYELSERIQVVIRYTLVILAIPLTICNIVVFFQRSMRSSTGTYVISMSLAQLVYIAVTCGVYIGDALYDFPLVEYSYCFYYLYVGVFLGSIAKRGTYLVMCLVSVERFYAIVRPFHIREFFLSKFPLFWTLAAYILAAAWHIYLPTRTVIIMVDNKVFGTMCRFVRTDLYLQTKEVNDAFSLTAKFVLSYGSLFGQLVLNVLTIWALRRHNTANRNVQTSANEEAKAQRERQMTVTILAATICYVSFAFPSVLNNIMSTVYKEYYSAGKYRNIYLVFNSLGLNLAFMSAGVDFVCFFTMSSNYRKTFFRLFSKCKKQPGLIEQEAATETTQTK
ncbi:hypothetical protein BaRGS_00018768 [Batillaria attramentaria]|uniref:G-protein coupled receptors family 1 profile domain-containing protein n=1 Tax=Batillaria attramentaria TaxID=370345 RepID=A0ABD0KT37_9CAEN